MNKNIAIELIEPHKDKLTSVAEWDAYASENMLPSSSNLIYLFGSWNNLKKHFSLKIRKPAYTKADLEIIAIKHKDFFVSKPIWDEYSKKKNLPASATFISAFGSWRNLKDILGIKSVRVKESYKKETLKKILKEHASNFINRHQWDIYAKENKLPTYKTIRKHFNYDEILKIVEKPKRINFSKEDLIKIALEHQDIFLHASMLKWDNYAKEKRLPSSGTFHKKFGSWRRAKHEITLRL